MKGLVGAMGGLTGCYEVTGVLWGLMGCCGGLVGAMGISGVLWGGWWML